MNYVALEDITNTGVTLRWPAGEPATKVVITPGDITRTLLGSEIQNGVVVIDGLDGETEYTAKLIYNDKTRGTVVFTTYIDISNAIVVRPTDDLVSLLEAATANQRFAIMPGEYNVASSINIPATVEVIGALPYDRPVINGAVLRLNAGAGLRLKDLILDGTTSDGNQTVIYNQVKDLHPQARAFQGVGEGQDRVARVVDAVDVIKIADAGLVHIMKEAQENGPGHIRAAFARQHIAYHGRAEGVFGHVFGSRTQELVSGAWGLTQHAKLKNKIGQTLPGLIRHGLSFRFGIQH